MSNIIVKIEVKKDDRCFYSPDYLHSNIGYVYDKDEEHIYIKAFKKDDRCFYSPDYLHNNIGYVYDKDEEHIYIKAFKKDDR